MGRAIKKCYVLSGNSNDVMKRYRGRWVIDFGPSMEESQASQFEAPFEHIRKHVRPSRLGNREQVRAERGGSMEG